MEDINSGAGSNNMNYIIIRIQQVKAKVKEDDEPMTQ